MILSHLDVITIIPPLNSKKGHSMHLSEKVADNRSQIFYHVVFKFVKLLKKFFTGIH